MPHNQGVPGSSPGGTTRQAYHNVVGLCSNKKNIPLRVYIRFLTKILHFRMEIQYYESPLCLIMEIAHEGLLCQSKLQGGFEHDGLDGFDEDIFKF